jgi:hypothetical protein
MALILIFTNKSDLAPISNYNYEVLVGDGTPERSKIIVSGAIMGHPRADGWQALVERLLQIHP